MQPRWSCLLSEPPATQWTNPAQARHVHDSDEHVGLHAVSLVGEYTETRAYKCGPLVGWRGLNDLEYLFQELERKKD